MDIYDENIEFLTKNPQMLRRAWVDPDDVTSQDGKVFPLFKMMGDIGDSLLTEEKQRIVYGCPSMIVSGSGAFKNGKYLPEFTEKVRNSGIPSDPYSIKVHHLPIFALLQREYDSL